MAPALLPRFISEPMLLVFRTISRMSCAVRCGNRTGTRDGTANSQARTDRSHAANTRSSSRSFSVGSIAAALVARRPALALRPVGRRAQAMISGAKGWRWPHDPQRGGFAARSAVAAMTVPV